MLIKDIIEHTCSVLPLFSDKFTTNVDISTIGKALALTEVTVETSAAHGYIDGQQVIISQVKTAIEITNITTDTDGVATATTAVAHDLTTKNPNFSNQPFNLTVEIQSPEAAYNDVFELREVIDATTFTFRVTGTPGDSTGTLLTFHNFGFNGVQIITSIPTTTSFTYELTDTRLSDGLGPNMFVGSAPRISGAATVDRAQSAYTKIGTDELWGIFVFQEMGSSEDRDVNNDSKNERTPEQEFKMRLISNISFYLFIPTKDDISGRAAIDTALTEVRAIYKTLARYLPPSIFVATPQTVLMPSAHGIEDYNASNLVYGYDFQWTEFLIDFGSTDNPDDFMRNSGDTLPNMGTRALSLFEIETLNEFDVVTKDDNFEVN